MEWSRIHGEPDKQRMNDGRFQPCRHTFNNIVTAEPAADHVGNGADAIFRRSQFLLLDMLRVDVESGKQHISVGHYHGICSVVVPPACLHQPAPLAVGQADVVAACDNHVMARRKPAVGRTDGFDETSHYRCHAPAGNTHTTLSASGRATLPEPIMITCAPSAFARREATNRELPVPLKQYMTVISEPIGWLPEWRRIRIHGMRRPARRTVCI